MDTARISPGLWWKRPFDLALTLGTLPLWLPLLLMVAAVVRLKMGSPVFFTQKRPGLQGKPFTMWKFRTMRQGPGDDANRLTPFGKALRGTGLDELPELFHVLAGTMSLVGPRPLLMDYLERYTPEQARRHLVRPGITGLAQIAGRNACSWEDQFRLDVEYVARCSPWLDLSILLRTIRLAVTREGSHQPGHATREPFKGSTPQS